MKAYWQKFYKYRWRLLELVRRDLKTKYRRSFLGYLWSVLNPLLMMTVLTIVFSQIFKSDIPNFPIYLLSGQLVFNFFSEATNTALTSIINSASLIKKVAMPKYILPMSKVLSAFVNMVFSLAALVIVVIITQTPITWTMGLIVFPMFYTFLLALGFGLILSSMSVFFRDMVHLYGILLTVVMYFTPLFYPVTILPNVARTAIKLNPLYHVVTMFRGCVLYGTAPTVTEHAICLCFGALFILIGINTFMKRQDQFILYI